MNTDNCLYKIIESDRYLTFLGLVQIDQYNHFHLSMLLARRLCHNIHYLTAISPLDGRYHEATGVLAQYFSESALMKYRVQVESLWLIHLIDNRVIPEEAPISGLKVELDRIAKSFRFEIAAAQRVKQIETVTNHDLKAIEYYMKENLTAYQEYVHFCCTSEDINNLAYALMLKDSLIELVIPKLTQICSNLVTKSEEWASHAMLAHTHGQSASPTTLGK